MKPDAQHGVDLPAPHRVARRAPERLAIIRQHADAPDDPERQHQRARQVRPVELALGGRNHPVDISCIDLVVEAREQPLRIVGVGDAAPPHGDDLIVRAQEPHVAFQRRIVLQPLRLLEPVPERRLRQRLQQIDGQHRDLGNVDEILEPAFGIVRVGIEAEDDARGDLQSVVVECLDRRHHRHGVVLILAHRLERVGFRRLDADEQCRGTTLPA